MALRAVGPRTALCRHSTTGSFQPPSSVQVKSKATEISRALDAKKGKSLTDVLTTVVGTEVVSVNVKGTEVMNVDVAVSVTGVVTVSVSVVHIVRSLVTVTG